MVKDTKKYKVDKYWLRILTNYPNTFYELKYWMTWVIGCELRARLNYHAVAIHSEV